MADGQAREEARLQIMGLEEQYNSGLVSCEDCSAKRQEIISQL